MKKLLACLILSCLAASAVYAQTIINTYAAAISYTVCKRELTVDSAVFFSVGDKVLVIQMKGMEIDSTNTSTFGRSVNTNNLGNYELNEVESISGSVLTLRFHLERSYNYSFGKVQVVKVPRYNTYTIATMHTCRPWNGLKGGVFAIYADDSLVLNNDINVTGRGFRPGITDSPVYITCCGDAHQTDYCFVHNRHYGAMKGEGVGEVSALRLNCRGPLYNGGGGANSHNSGGGGGGNAGRGGMGGKEWLHSAGSPLANGGLGGYNFTYSPSNNQIYLGGGGGAGHGNDGQISDGGAGGGIVFIITNKIVGNNDSIIADGAEGKSCMSYGVCFDAVGGGGGGGTVLINAPRANALHISTRGGNGGSIYSAANGGHGPGGGGGGGAILLDNASLLSTVATVITNGAAGLQSGALGATTSWGALPGDTGIVVTGFRAYVDTLRGGSSKRTDTAFCAGNRVPITYHKNSIVRSWLWNTGSTDSLIIIDSTGLYTVIVYDGLCYYTDTFIVTVNPIPLAPIVTSPLSYCKGAVAPPLSATGAGLVWYVTPGSGGTSIAPVPSTATAGTYVWYVSQNLLGCEGPLDSILVNILELPSVDFDDTIMYSCVRDSILFFNLSNNCTSYRWHFDSGGVYATTRNIVKVIQPVRSIKTYRVKLVGYNGICMDSITKTITILPTPSTFSLTNVTGSQTIIEGNSTQLNALGAILYLWKPNDGTLSDPNINNPIATPIDSTTYTVYGYDSLGCLDSAMVQINVIKNRHVTVPNAFSPNGDGKNDVFKVLTANGKLHEFAVYNRWGEVVFKTNDINKGWDGTYNGVPQDIGVYNYMVILMITDGEQSVIKGTVTLMR